MIRSQEAAISTLLGILLLLPRSHSCSSHAFWCALMKVDAIMERLDDEEPVMTSGQHISKPRHLRPNSIHVLNPVIDCEVSLEVRLPCPSWALK